jgi:hypothetical protein
MQPNFFLGNQISVKATHNQKLQMEQHPDFRKFFKTG